MTDDRRLDDLAGRILDGRRVDWEAEAADGLPADAALLAELRTLADIVALNRGSQETPVPAGASGTPTPAGEAEGSGIGRWGPLDLVEKVGQGSFAEVYRARDPHLDRDVALKLLRHTQPVGGAGTAVVAEGKLLAAVRHPNVVGVHGAGTFDGRVGIWTEYVHGQTLEDELTMHGPFSARETALAGIDLCRALAAVHAAGVLHRDVKARNVMREQGGRLVLMDFGMGQLASDASPERGSSGGTPLYMAPELFDDGPATLQADIYALGVLLWHLLTGGYPVVGTSLDAVREAHRVGRRAHLRDQRTDLPPALVNAIERAVDPDAARRFATAREFEAALGDAIGADADDTPAVSQVAPDQRTGRDTERPLIGRAWLALAAAVTVLVAAGAGWYATHRQPPGPVIPFEERDWVLLGAFENRTGDSRFDGTIEYLLGQELAMSQFVNVVPRERVNDTLKLMKKPTASVLDAGVGLEVCRRDGAIRGFVIGRTEKLASDLLVSVSLLDPAADGRVVFAGNARAPDVAALPAALRSIADRIRASLGEEARRIRGSRPPLERVTTPSMHALQLYTAGMAAVNEGAWQTAVGLLSRAVETDSGFAMAHILLAWALWNTDHPEAECVARARRAWDLADQTTERERGFIRGSYYSMTRDDASAVTEYETVLRLYPDDQWSLRNLRMAVGRIGPREAGWSLALREAALRPNDFTSNLAAARALMESGQSLAEARPFVERLRTLDPSATLPLFRTWLRLFPACEAWVEGDLTRAADAVSGVAGDASATATDVVGAGLFQLGLGRVADAERTFLLLPAGVERDVYLGEAARWRGDTRALRSHVARAYDRARRPGVIPTTDIRALEELVVLLADSGRTADARNLQKLAREGLLGNFPQVMAFPSRPDEQTIAEADRARVTKLPPRSMRTLWLAGKIASAMADRGESARAVRVLEQATDSRLVCHPGGAAQVFWLAGRAQLASLYRRMGRPTDADAVEAELRPLLAQADADFVVLQQIAR